MSSHLTRTLSLPGQEFIPWIEEGLARYSDFGAGCPSHLSAAIRHSLLAPGKRLRPLLVLLAARACGCDARTALPAACAVEMIHCYSLIHDDLPAMDDDDMRRGQPSCHAAFGEATAILAGDALIARSFEIIAEDLPANVAAECCRELARAAGACQLVGGQADDLESDSQQPSKEQLQAIHRRKTGAMFTVSLRLGGIIAGADKAQLNSLISYGDQLGLAFQIIDDLLDAEGTADAMGKRTQKDAERGKLTFPAVYGNEASRQQANQLIEGACDAVARIGPRAADLAALARFVLQRNK